MLGVNRVSVNAVIIRCPAIVRTVVDSGAGFCIALTVVSAFIRRTRESIEK